MRSIWMVGVLVSSIAVFGCGKGGGGSGGDETEARIELDRIGKTAKMLYARNDMFPTGTEALTPATACCSQPGKVCKPIAADWNRSGTGHPWSDLDFEMTQDFKYQYSYKGAGQSFTATAVGDPDCDGHTITVTLSGTVAVGNPAMKIVVEKQ